jgi:hypothetical protein
MNVVCTFDTVVTHVRGPLAGRLERLQTPCGIAEGGGGEEGRVLSLPQTVQLSVSEGQDASWCFDTFDLDAAAGSRLGVGVKEGGERCHSRLGWWKLGGRTRGRRGESAGIQGGSMSLCCSEAASTDVKAQSLHLCMSVMGNDEGGELLLVSIGCAVMSISDGGDKSSSEQCTQMREDGAARGGGKQTVQEGGNLGGG